MPAPDVAAAVEESIDGLRLLDHPYYTKWQEGLLTRDDLGAYAEQYRSFEQYLPEALAAAAEQLGAGAARDLVTSNLEDELSRPEPHVRLFETFAAAVGAEARSFPSGATRRLVEVYREAVAEGPVPVLSVIAAYEVQAADIAATKADSLERHYSLNSESIRFWTVHSDLEQSHAAWTTAALEHLEADATTVSEWSGRSARAWWEFLDERMECSLAGV